MRHQLLITAMGHIVKEGKVHRVMLRYRGTRTCYSGEVNYLSAAPSSRYTNVASHRLEDSLNIAL